MGTGVKYRIREQKSEGPHLAGTEGGPVWDWIWAEAQRTSCGWSKRKANYWVQAGMLRMIIRSPWRVVCSFQTFHCLCRENDARENQVGMTVACPGESWQCLDWGAAVPSREGGTVKVFWGGGIKRDWWLGVAQWAPLLTTHFFWKALEKRLHRAAGQFALS